MQSLRNVSLKTRTTVAVSALFVICAGAIAAWALALFEIEKKASLSAQAYSLVSTVADNIDSKLRLVHGTIIRVAATVPTVALADAESAQDFLDRQVALHALFDNGLFLVSLDRKLVAESPWVRGANRRGRDLSEREFVQRTLATREPYISKPYRSTHNPGQPALIMTAPVYNAAGEMIGLIEGSLDLLGSNILADLATQRIGRTGYLFLADGRDTMIVHPDKRRVMGPMPGPGENRLFDRALDGFEGAGETVNSTGVPALEAIKRIKSTGWTLGAILPLAEFYAPIRAAQRYFLLSIVLGTLAVLVLVWLLANRLLAPLSSMTRQVKAMAGESSTQARLPIRSGDEIGVLAIAFNEMLEKLSRLNAELEGRVAERTAALAEARARSEEAHRMLLAVLDAIPLRVFWKDLNSRYLGGNQLFARSAGKASPQEIVGMTDDEFVWRDLADMYRANDAWVIEHGQPRLGIEYPLTDLNGDERWRRTSKVPLRDASGDVIGVLGVSEEITARKVIERALQAARDEAERANLAKSEFLSRMSHELRTPLNAILGFGQVLQSDAQHPLAEKQQVNVREILHAGSHLLELINEVLDLARIESGKFKVNSEPVALMPVISNCLTLIRPQAEARGIRLVGPGGEGDERVRADPTRLKQVLLNLLSNAVKYNRERGTVGIVCERLEKQIEIRVHDTGLGISEERQARLFVAFERLDADKTAVEGTGIGLVLTKRLVELMQGEIGVQSKPGAGSTFWVRLPRVHAAPLSAA